MIIQLKWLNELVDLTGLSLKEISDKLSLYSTEVEKTAALINATNIVVGHVQSKEAHPNSDHLSVLMVDVGQNEVLQIVCGAPNVEANQYVIVALVGAKLPGDFIIKQSKIRGVDSYGMVCSLQELGIEKKYIDEEFTNGIYYFNEPKPVGMDGAVALELDGDTIEIDVMPNRGDLLSMLGVAYEISALFNRPLKALKLPTYEIAKGDNFEVYRDNDLCSSYYAQVIRNIKIKPSPLWLKSRLIAFGIRPINNVVDITNYILALFGQPLHAFDYDLLGKKIVVRNAYENESFITLDRIKRNLITSDLVITDGLNPIALAGVMGGLATEVNANTKNILLEAAVFDPLTIRKTSTRLGLRSESSLRYERGVSLNRTEEALSYATQLLVDLAEASVAGVAVHSGVKTIADKTIEVPTKKINNVLGLTLDEKIIAEILRRLNFKYQLTEQGFKISVPNRRNDLLIPEDIIEEIARLYGYNNIPATLPWDNQCGYLQPKQINRRKIKNTLAILGLNEILTYSLVAKNSNSDQEELKLLMPLSEERSILRASLIPSILEVIKYNYSRKNTSLAFFEMSKVYLKQGGVIFEKEYLSGALSNTFTHTYWQRKSEKVDFFLVKGLLKQLFSELNLEVKFLPYPKELKLLHPKRSAKLILNNEEIGCLGQLHPQYAQENSLDEIYLFEINLEKIINNNNSFVVFKPLSKLPAVQRDLAFLCNINILASEIVDAIYKTDKQLISNVEIFDLYQGENISEEEKSIAVNIIFSSDEPLNDEIINKKIEKIIKDLNFRFKARLRD